MAKQIKVIKVDDVEYSVSQIGGVEGGDLFDRLTQEMGDGVVDGVRQAMTSGNMTDAALAAVMMRALVRLSPGLKRDLRTKFAQLTTINGGSFEAPLCPPDAQLQEGGMFDQHFAGRFPHMWKWLLAAMQWGFASFLPSSGASEDAKPGTTPTT